MSHFCLNVNAVDDVRQTEMHTAELAVTERSAFESETDFEKLKRYKSQDTDKIPAELI
jgi:hypothetical protein